MVNPVVGYLFQTIARRFAATTAVDAMSVRKARKWFREQAMLVSRADPQKIMDSAGAFEKMKNMPKTGIGKMYMFRYDPKHKDTLPYYDRFPLVFPIEFYPDGFLGINLHYLPPQIRAELMDSLYTTLNNDSRNNKTKLNINYRVLKGASKHGAFKPCVKRYLYSHVQGAFMYVKPDNWDMALMLPTERFVKAGKARVWADSLKKI